MVLRCFNGNGFGCWVTLFVRSCLPTIPSLSVYFEFTSTFPIFDKLTWQTPAVVSLLKLWPRWVLWVDLYVRTLFNKSSSHILTRWLFLSSFYILCRLMDSHFQTDQARKQGRLGQSIDYSDSPSQCLRTSWRSRNPIQAWRESRWPWSTGCRS